MAKLGTPVELVTLPTWTDAASVTSYVTSFVAGAAALITALHPGWHEPTEVQTVLPTVGLLIAGVAQAINLYTHRAAQKAAIVAKGVVTAASVGYPK
jgi:hypothetical protein